MFHSDARVNGVLFRRLCDPSWSLDVWPRFLFNSGNGSGEFYYYSKLKAYFSAME